jgi:hypothetical protein
MFVNGLGRNEQSYREPSIDASYQVSLGSFGKAVLAILVSDWSISKRSSPLKSLCQMNRNLVGSIYGRFSINRTHFVPITNKED